MILETLQTVLAFILTLAILVSVHEFGHFWVARRCGVKVLRFSVGFGKPLWTWLDRHGTEYALAMIPLGGYVKMLDEREGPVASQERHLSFNAQPVLARIAIVIAGPLANFLLAILALWLMYMVGIRTILPQVGAVRPDSPAAVAGLVAGDEIVSIDGRSTASWQGVSMALLPALGESRVIRLQVRPGEPGQASTAEPVERTVQVQNWLTGNEQPDPIQSLGITPYSPPIPAVIGELVQGGAARAAGLQVGDRIIRADGESVRDWLHWVELVRARPGQTMAIDILRDQQLLSLALTPAERLADGQTSGYIGAAVKPTPWPEELVRTLQFGPFSALIKGAEATWSLTSMTFQSLWKMIAGLVSVKNLSGPITIAKVAGASLQSGFESFLYFLGMLSVSLGVLNLLPVPVLDGGHLLFYMVELVRGRPLSEKAQILGLKLGVTLVVCVMILAIYNDLSRLF